MTQSTVEQQLMDYLRRMSHDQQQRLLDYARQIQDIPPSGIPGEVLVERARSIDWPPEDLAEMVAAIEEDCERVDPDGWD